MFRFLRTNGTSTWGSSLDEITLAHSSKFEMLTYVDPQANQHGDKAGQNFVKGASFVPP